MTWRERAGWFWKNYGLVLILALGALHGLLYIFLVPPWQHPDEPTHFEYAWLIANRPGLPREGDYDQDMRRQVAASMLEHGFFRNLNWKPDLLSSNQPVEIGLSELRHPPAYYLLVSLPLQLLQSTDIAFQLYVSRLVSLFLLLVTIVAAWGITTEIVPAGHSLRWMVPLSMVLLPAYTDLMTSVNNDVGAITVSSLCLWGCMYLIRRGFSFWGLLFTVATAALGLWTKTTTYVLVPLVLLCVLFSLFRGTRQRLIWGSLLLGGLGGLLAIFSWGDAAFWYRNTVQSIPTRAATPQAPAAPYSLQLEIIMGSPTPAIYQFLATEQVVMLREKTVTVGVWMWATQAFKARTPVLHVDGSVQASKDIVLDTLPKYYAFSAVIPDNANRIWVSLEQPLEEANVGTITLYNGIVLAEGLRPIGESPEFDDVQETRGIWGGSPFRNILQNTSAESEWPWIRPWADTLGEVGGFGQPSFILSSLLDWQGAGWYYQETIQQLLETFWAKFGWGHVPLLDPRLYSVLAAFTLLGLAGAVVGLYRTRAVVQWDAVLVLGIAFGGIWSFALVRGVAESLVGSGYVPGARYAYPAIIPTVLVLSQGWREVFGSIGQWLRIPALIQAVLYIALFLILDVLALFSVVSYYSVR